MLKSILRAMSLFAGSYFARDAKYSHSYTKDSGTRSMFVCRILVGDYTKGESQLPPASIQRRRRHRLLRQLVNDVFDPSIFVVFEKHQIYPEYLMEYSDSSGFDSPVRAAVARPTVAVRHVAVPAYSSTNASVYNPSTTASSSHSSSSNTFYNPSSAASSSYNASYISSSSSRASSSSSFSYASPSRSSSSYSSTTPSLQSQRISASFPDRMIRHHVITLCALEEDSKKLILIIKKHYTIIKNGIRKVSYTLRLKSRWNRSSYKSFLLYSDMHPNVTDYQKKLGGAWFCAWVVDWMLRCGRGSKSVCRSG